MTPLEKSILATVSYYDIFDYPLTGFEIWRYLVLSEEFKNDKFTAGDLFEAINDGGELKNKISQKHGFYFFAGREEIVEKRLWRKKLADEKWKKMKKVFELVVLVPFVRGIFISGSLAMENSKTDSDIDIIVVAKHGRIWTVRTLMTVLTTIFGVRRHGNKTEDRICLNHYITDESLRIPFESLYNAESYIHLTNLYNGDKNIFRLFQEGNGWIGNYLINYKISKLGSVRSLDKNRFFVSVSKIFEMFLSGFLGNNAEKIFASVESRRIRRDILYEKSGGRITIDESQLEFHPDSHENFIIPEFNRRMRGAGIMEFAHQKDSGLNE
ncbi:MAG: hypothetical protein PHI66_04320 [Candidatus Pacebacteria bacterium]|nr:hypothetical protein [Candidatus Paceibacterota bacterium]